MRPFRGTGALLAPHATALDCSCTRPAPRGRPSLQALNGNTPRRLHARTPCGPRAGECAKEVVRKASGDDRKNVRTPRLLYASPAMCSAPRSLTAVYHCVNPVYTAWPGGGAWTYLLALGMYAPRRHVPESMLRCVQACK
ncbi:hypothetical protein EON67_07060 [archaeon]|nr:MAG: hypothetical protein EON67_07060 [archaeon]